MSTIRNASLFHMPAPIRAPHPRSVAGQAGGRWDDSKAPSPGHASTACLPSGPRARHCPRSEIMNFVPIGVKPPRRQRG
jgi:hypothetical protein